LKTQIIYQFQIKINLKKLIVPVPSIGQIIASKAKPSLATTLKDIKVAFNETNYEFDLPGANIDLKLDGS